MRPNSRRHDEHAPHVRAVSTPLPPAQPARRGADAPTGARRSRARRKRDRAPAREVRSAVDAALVDDEQVAVGDE